MDAAAARKAQVPGTPWFEASGDGMMRSLRSNVSRSPRCRDRRALVRALSVHQVAAPAAAPPADPLLAGFARSTVASVADAVDQVVGKRGYLSHDMRPHVAGAFVGRAATALVKPASPEQATPALAVKHSVEMIDGANPGDVGVIVMEGSLDVAAIGGLMGTAAKARGMAGMVLDGAVRDLAELRALDLPVYARAVSPATAVSRSASVAKDVPVECAGSPSPPATSSWRGGRRGGRAETAPPTC